MKAKEFKRIKKEYLETEIPDELHFVVKKALKESEQKMSNRNQKISGLKAAAIAAVASLIILTAGINTSAVFAQSISKIPIVGGLAKVITFREYSFSEDTFQANLETPSISGLENKDLEHSLNTKYLQDNELLYAQFLRDMEIMKENGGGHLGLDSGYVVKTDNEKILSVGRYVVNTVASSSTVFKYDTIDKEKEILLTLPSLFKDGTYVEVISENIKAQMLEQNQENQDKIYWVEGIAEEDFGDLFQAIAVEQSFYINPEHKLVISFDKYGVAPGYMGMVEFVIPTDVLKDILVGNDYLN